MKRHISFFAFLLCVFAAVGPIGTAKANVKIVCQEKVTLSFGNSSKQLTYPAAPKNDSEGYYNEFGGDLSVTAPANPPSDSKGTYRIEWLTLPNDVLGDYDDGLRSKLSDCTKVIAKTPTLSVTAMGDAKTSDYAYYEGDPLIALKYIRQYTVSTEVSPDGAGTVTGGATVDAGGSVTLTAKENPGWTFSEWSDGNTDRERKITNIGGDVNLTAKFIPLGYSVSTQSENAKITVAKTGVYTEDLEISWEPEGAEGYDYTFVSAQVLNGNTPLATYTETPATFNMKDRGQYYSSVNVAVKYTKTAQNRDLKLEFNEGIETIGYKVGNAAEWTVVTEDTKVKVPVGTQWQAYAAAADGYVHTETSPEKPRVGIMGANGATFSPTASLDGFTLTVDPNGGFFKGSQEKYTFNFRLRAGLTNLNEIGTVTFTNGSSLIEFRDEKGEPVYDNQGHNVEGTYWTANYPSGTFRGTGNLTVKAIPGEPAPQFTITTSVYPEGAGIAEGAGRYNQGSNIVLKATANTGYSFWHWTKDDEEVSTATNYQLTVTANAEYVAVFTGNVYTVTYRTEGGHPENPKRTVTFGSPYGEPPAVTKDGYELVGWFTDYDGEGVRINPDTPVETAKNHNLIAYWKEKTEFTVTFADPEGGHESISEERTKGLPIGEPAGGTENWKRDGYWRDNDSDWDPPLSTVVTGNMTVNAKWTSIADMLDCSNLIFNSTGNWRPYYEDLTAVNKNCMRLDSSAEMGDPALSTVITNDGTMTFSWKAGVVGVNLRVRMDNDQFTNFTAKAADDWQTETMAVPLSGKTERGLAFHLLSTDIKASWCALDHVTWTTGIEPAKRYTVTFHDPSGTFSDKAEPVDEGGEATAPPWISDKFDPRTCGWDSDFSQVMGDITVNAVWTCRVEFVDGEGGNPPVTNKVDYGQPVVAPTSFTPPADKHFGGWDPSVPATIKSNSVFTVIWTDNPTYTVTYSWDKETQTDTKKQGVPLTLKVAIFTRAGYEQDGWSKNPDGSVRDFKLGDSYSADADLTLYPTWKELKPVVIDEIARALDCEGAGLTFELAGGWSVFTNESFAQEGISCLSNNTDNATVTVTIPQSGTLTFYWCGRGSSSYAAQLLVYVNDERVGNPLTAPKNGTPVDWSDSPVSLDLSKGDVVVFKNEPRAGKYTALDHFTWTPEGGGEPTPGVQVEVTEAGVVDGVFSLTIPTDPGTDYGVWTNADLTVDSWGLMGEPQKGEGKPMEFKWTIFPGFQQLFFRAHKVEYKK